MEPTMLLMEFNGIPYNSSLQFDLEHGGNNGLIESSSLQIISYESKRREFWQ